MYIYNYITTAFTDVDGVTHVINYDYPNTSEDYIHRIGRTGRQDNKGVSHTILTEENARQAKGLIDVLKEAKQVKYIIINCVQIYMILLAGVEVVVLSHSVVNNLRTVLSIIP